MLQHLLPIFTATALTHLKAKQLTSIKIDTGQYRITLTEHFIQRNWSVIKDSDKFRLCDGHRRVLVLLMRHYGKKVSTGYFFQLIRQQYGDGIRKAYIEECKLILHRNGYMTAKAWGETGTQYQWRNPHEVCTVVRARLFGVDDARMIALSAS